MSEALGSPRQVKGLVFLLSLIGLIALLGEWIITGSTQMLVLGGMAIALVAVVITTLSDWRNGLYLFLGWLLFEDLARKYLGNGTILFFGKDVLAAIVYLSFFRTKQRGRVPSFKPGFLVPLTLFFGLAVVQCLNTASPNIVYGLLGLKLYFYYVPLMFAGYALIRSSLDLEKFLVYNVAMGLLIAVLGIIQSVVGVTFLNPAELAPEIRALAMLRRESPITHQVLWSPTSVFVSSGRFAYYMILLAILAIGAQAYLLLTRRRRANWGFVGVGVSLVAAMQSGSRGCILWVVISGAVLSAGFLWGAPWKWGQGHRLVKAFRRALIVGAASLFLMLVLFPDKIGANWAFYEETLNPTSASYQLGSRSWDYPLANLELAFQDSRWLVGNGTGTSSLGIQYIAKFLGASPSTSWVENGWGVLILEMGILGPVAWLLWTLALLVCGWQIVRELRQTAYLPIALSIWWYAFTLLIPLTYNGMSPYQNYVMNAYLWLLIGVLFRLPHLARAGQPLPLQSAAPELVAPREALPSYVTAG